MLNTLWFLLKITAVLALILWIAEHPGDVALEWMDYKFTLHIGVFAAVLLALIFGVITLYRAYKALTMLPKKIVRHQEVKATKRGYAALTKGLSAVAAGDVKTAARAVKDSARLLHDKNAGDTHALTLLLQAQTAQMQGKPKVAHAAFTQLADHKDGSFLGIRGLLRTALENNNLEEARVLSDKALKKYPAQPWILKTTLDIRIRQKDWPAALDARKKLHKINAHTNDNKQRPYSEDVAALHTAHGLALLEEHRIADATKTLRRALKTIPAFVPAALALARSLKDTGKRKQAIKVIENIWRNNPHPDFIPLWMSLITEKKKDKASARMAWIEHLVIINTNSIESHIAAAQQALSESLWGEARSYLERALTLDPDVRVYDLLIRLEQDGTRDLAAIDKWQDALQNAAPAPCWVCVETGRLYDRWHPISPPHGTFNTIHWGTADMFIDQNIAGILTHDKSAL